MQDRQEYFQNYYASHKKTIIKDAKQYYKKHRKECLTNHRKYYKINKEEILAKNKMKTLKFRGHAYSIWHAIKKYAKLWDLPICDFSDFYEEWTVNDPTYQELYDAWVDSGYDKFMSPVVMRKVKKNGFVPENLKWDVKKNYSWWNEDAAIFKDVANNMEEQQRERNKRNKEWRKKVREQIKAKQKEKKDA